GVGVVTAPRRPCGRRPSLRHSTEPPRWIVTIAGATLESVIDTFAGRVTAGVAAGHAASAIVAAAATVPRRILTARVSAGTGSASTSGGAGRVGCAPMAALGGTSLDRVAGYLRPPPERLDLVAGGA